MCLICHHTWDNYMAYIICVANACILPKLLCLGHLKQTRDIKINNLKLQIGIIKKPIKQGSRYCLIVLVECVIHMAYCSVGI